MREKHPIHTTISTAAVKVIERYEGQLGGKNAVLEKALLSMEKYSAGATTELLDQIAWIEIGFLEPLLKKIPEGSIVGIVGPPSLASEITLFMAAIIDSLLKIESKKKQCSLISTRKKLFNFYPATRKWGMKMKDYEASHSLNVYTETEIDTLYGIFKIVRKSDQGIICIDVDVLKEGESRDVKTIINSSGAQILREEIAEKKMICFVGGNSPVIEDYCDIVISLSISQGNRNSVITRVIRRVMGMDLPVPCGLEINGTIKLLPLPETIAKAPSDKNGTLESLKDIADKTDKRTEPVVEKL